MIEWFFICFDLLLIEYFVCLVCAWLSVEMEIEVVGMDDCWVFHLFSLTIDRILCVCWCPLKWK
jgi:hypothetical protein